MQDLCKFLLLYLLTYHGQNAFGSEIVHGKKVPDDLMLYMVSVQHDKIHTCGGFLISEDFVVTAAHCDSNKSASVVLGTHNLKKVDDKTMRYDVKRCKHPDFVKASKGNDIMLLKLSRKARLNNRVQPIQLPKTNSTKDSGKCRVAGWGFTKTGGKSVDVLQVVDVPIIPLEECRKQWKKIKVTLPVNVICAGGYNIDKGFCKGDSGGPLVCGATALGVVSFNIDCDYPSAPNVYTDISKYLPWIKKILKQKDC